MFMFREFSTKFPILFFAIFFKIFFHLINIEITFSFEPRIAFNIKCMTLHSLNSLFKFTIKSVYMYMILIHPHFKADHHQCQKIRVYVSYMSITNINIKQNKPATKTTTTLTITANNRATLLKALHY